MKVVSFLKDKALVAAVAGTTVLTAVSAHAANADIDAMFASVDITGIQTKIVAMATAGILIAVIFVGWRFIKKGLNRL